MDKRSEISLLRKLIEKIDSLDSETVDLEQIKQHLEANIGTLDGTTYPVPASANGRKKGDASLDFAVVDGKLTARLHTGIFVHGERSIRRSLKKHTLKKFFEKFGIINDIDVIKLDGFYNLPNSEPMTIEELTNLGIKVISGENSRKFVAETSDAGVVVEIQNGIADNVVMGTVSFQ